jgi:hypothetical protein
MMAQAQNQIMDTYTVALNKGDGLYGLYARTWRNSFGTPLIMSGSLDDVLAVSRDTTEERHAMDAHGWWLDLIKEAAWKRLPPTGGR